MAALAEVRTTLLSFFGRLADHLTRRVLRPEQVFVTLQEQGFPPALLKEDGHFAFHDLEPSATAYHVRVGGPAYLTRTLTASLPTTAPVQLTFPGEDELYVALAGPADPQGHVPFEKIDFVPPIAAGATVVGPAFVTTLADPLEGRDVGLARLASAGGLATGDVLRIVRSPNLRLRPGPYYPFPAGLTVVAVRVVESTPAEAPLAEASLTIDRLDGTAATSVTVGGLPLSRFVLSSSATAFVVLDDAERATATNGNGDAVFYFPSSVGLTSLRIAVSRPQYLSTTVTIPVTARTRGFTKVPLTRV